MKIVSERISIINKDKLFSLVILPQKNKLNMRLLFFWLFAWSVCGVIVMANYFKLTNENTKLFVIVYLSFWAYFEYKIIRVYMWKRDGKEKLWIADGQLFYQQEVYNKGKIKSYDLNLLNEIKEIDKDRSGFAEVINSSFWMKGSENLEIIAGGKTIRFGYQLSEKETDSILKEIRQFIKSIKKV